MESPQLILQWIRKRTHVQPTNLVSIDGPGGTGKTTLAQSLQLLDPSIAIVHMDHFDLPTNGKILGDPGVKEIGADTDWQRLLREVILPLREGKKGQYRPFNRDSGELGEKRIVAPSGTVIVEGVFSMRKELFSYLDSCIWLTCPLQVRLQRALRRDGEEMRNRWENDWIPMEERYIAEHKPYMYAHKIIDTTY